MHFAQSESNWIQFWIWINFLNWCSVTKFFLVATPLNAHTLTSFNSEMDDILINITFDCFSWRTLSRLLHGMDDPPLSVKNPKKGEINSGFGSTSKIGAQCHVEIHWHVLILRGMIFYKTWHLIVSVEGPLIGFSTVWTTPAQTTTPEIINDYH